MIGGPARARWHVMWVARGRVIEKAFGDDMAGALELHNKALLAGKRGVTLCCKNMSFPPPEKYRPRHVKFKKRVGRKVEIHTALLVPMKKLNRQGVWWCPYCNKLRKFVHRNGFKTQGVWVPDPGWHCPICTVSHRDGAVRKWNPVAARLMNNPPRRRSRGTGRRR